MHGLPGQLFVLPGVLQRLPVRLPPVVQGQRHGHHAHLRGLPGLPRLPDPRPGQRHLLRLRVPELLPGLLQEHPVQPLPAVPARRLLRRPRHSLHPVPRWLRRAQLRVPGLLRVRPGHRGLLPGPPLHHLQRLAVRTHGLNSLRPVHTMSHGNLHGLLVYTRPRRHVPALHRLHTGTIPGPAPALHHGLPGAGGPGQPLRHVPPVRQPDLRRPGMRRPLAPGLPAVHPVRPGHPPLHAGVRHGLRECSGRKCNPSPPPRLSRY